MLKNRPKLCQSTQLMKARVLLSPTRTKPAPQPSRQSTPPGETDHRWLVLGPKVQMITRRWVRSQILDSPAAEVVSRESPVANLATVFSLPMAPDPQWFRPVKSRTKKTSRISNPAKTMERYRSTYKSSTRNEKTRRSKNCWMRRPKSVHRELVRWVRMSDSKCSMSSRKPRRPWKPR